MDCFVLEIVAMIGQLHVAIIRLRCNKVMLRLAQQQLELSCDSVSSSICDCIVCPETAGKMVLSQRT